jgi:hypothetical protein
MEKRKLFLLILGELEHAFGVRIEGEENLGPVGASAIPVKAKPSALAAVDLVIELAGLQTGLG